MKDYSTCRYHLYRIGEDSYCISLKNKDDKEHWGFNSAPAMLMHINDMMQHDKIYLETDDDANDALNNDLYDMLPKEE